MTTFLDIIPSELLNIIFSYIDQLECAINLVEISSFNKLFNNPNYWKSLIREKIGYLIEALDVNFELGVIYNIITYFKCISIYVIVIKNYDQSIAEIKKEKYYNKYIIENMPFNNISLFIHLITDHGNIINISNNIFKGYGNSFHLKISGCGNIKYSLKILIQYSNFYIKKELLSLTKEEYLKILFYGYYNDF